MKRKFLYEIMEDLESVEEIKDLKDVLYMYLDNARGFKILLDIIYNHKYEYEFDKSIMKTTSRSKRDNGGFSTAWLDVVRVLQSKLINVTNLSSRVPDFYIKACRACNHKDVEILNYALMHRNLPGFKGARKKILVDLLDEYYGVKNGETV